MLTVDPSNPVIAAVARGTAAEFAGDLEAARVAYEAAWRAASTDFEHCIAAHYVPRTIDDPLEKLGWNEAAIRFAEAANDDDRVAGFSPSLHASVARCRLELRDTAGAQRAFEHALAHLDAVPDAGLRTGLAALIEDGLAAVRRAAANSARRGQTRE